MNWKLFFAIRDQCILMGRIEGLDAGHILSPYFELSYQARDFF